MKFHGNSFLIGLALAVILTLNTAPARADLAPPKGWHAVKRCVTITNLAEFSEISLAVRLHLGQSTRHQYLVKPDDCLYQGYKFNKVEIYALPAGYVNQKGLKNIDLASDDKAVISPAKMDLRGGHVGPDVPLIAEQAYWRILGFSGRELILHKYREVLQFNNGQADKVRTWSNPKIEKLRLTID